MRTDNGPEFTCRAFIASTQAGLRWRHILIQQDWPMQNGYIYSFNSEFRDECLNEHCFQTLPQARSEIAIWCQDYNEGRPHSSLEKTVSRVHPTPSHQAPSIDFKQRDQITFNLDFRLGGMAKGHRSGSAKYYAHTTSTALRIWRRLCTGLPSCTTTSYHKRHWGMKPQCKLLKPLR